MSDSGHRSDELETLISAVIDGQITSEQHARLAALLRADAAARKQYVELIVMHSLLRQTLGGYAIKQAKALSVLADIAEAERLRPVEIPEAGQTSAKARWQRMRLSPAKKAAALFLVVGGLAAIILFALSSNHPALKPVASMTQSHDAAWETAQGDAMVIEEGASLLPQTLRLRQGLAKVTFESGAVAVLDARESPARFELKGRAEAALHAGRVTISAEGETEKGFIINLRDDRAVMQLDTQLGIDMDQGGATRMHVLAGDVELRPLMEKVSVPARWMRQGDAVAFHNSSAVREISAKSTGFVPFKRTMRLENRGMPRTDGSPAIPVQPSQVGGAASVVVHYLFQRDDNAQTTLADRGPGARHGTITGATWVDGRRAGTNALAFTRPGDRVRINIPGTFTSLSLTAWVRMDRLTNKFHSLMLTDGFETGEVHWQVTEAGKLEFSVKYEAKVENDYFSPVVPALTRGEWVHVATVYDAGSGRVVFYVNGVEVGAERIHGSEQLRIGEAMIGNWAGLPDKAPERRELIGAMSELTIHDGALTAAEIQQMYEDSNR